MLYTDSMRSQQHLIHMAGGLSQNLKKHIQNNWVYFKAVGFTSSLPKSPEGPTLVFLSVVAILWSNFTMIQLSQKAAKSTCLIQQKKRACFSWRGQWCQKRNKSHSADQILMSWDSTIFAKVFLTRRMVRRDAGLWAQHSDISFNMALEH